MRISLDRAVAAIVVAVALAVAFDQAPALLRADRLILAQPSYSLERSDLDPLSFWVPSGTLKLAREEIPSGATYTIVLGSDPPLLGDTRTAVQPIFQAWLLPRRYTPKLGQAQWVIAYHRALASIHLGRPITHEIDLTSNATLLEVGR